MSEITKIEAFVQNSPHPAWLATSRGECLYVNPALVRLTGLKSDQINQVDWRIFVLEEDRVAASESWQRSLASRTPFRTTIRLRGHDGVPATVELIAYGHTHNDGTELWLFTGLNVNGATQQHPGLGAQLQATLNVIPAYTWYALPSGALTFVNERTGDYLGLPKDHPLRFGIDTGAEWDAHIPLLHPDDREESRRVWSACVRTGSPSEISFRVRSAEGEYRWFLSRVEALRASDGTLLFWIGVNLDVDERKQAEERLVKSGQERERELVAIIETVPSMLWSMSPTGEMIHLSERCLEYAGASFEEIVSCGWLSFIHPDDRDGTAKAFSRAIETGEPYNVIHRARRADGDYRWHHAQAEPMRDPDGKIIQWYGLLIDIDERKRAEDKIRLSEKELRALVETIPVFVGTALPDGSCDFLSESWLDYLGFTTEQGLGWGWADSIHPGDVDRVVANWRAGLAAGEPVEQELRCRRADGAYRWFLNRNLPLRDENGNVVKWYGILFDIDEIKNWETKLRRVFDAIPTLAFCSFADGSKEFINKRWLDYTGLSPEESHGWGWQVAFHPEDLPLLMKEWEEVLVSGKRGEVEARLRRYDGVYRWFLNRVEPFVDDTGKIIRWYGTSTDIDALKKTETALQMREHELLGIIETIPSMLWSTSPTGEVTHISQRVLEYTGLSLEDFLNLGWKRIIHPDDFEDTTKAFFGAIQTGESYNAIHRLRRRDGEYRWYRASGEPLRDFDGKIIQWYGLSIDIDERKRAEDHLRDTRMKLAKASRLATIAELAGSIAHELNQPLMSILTNAQAANRWLNTTPSNVTEVTSSIERIIRDARAADETMQHIRALFKQESFDKKNVNIPDMLSEVVRVVQEDPKKRHVPIECRFLEFLPAIHVDKIQIQQVFINLIVNAIEAFEGQQMAPLVVLRAATDSNGILIQVIDNGPGVDDPDRIFDAFMTTKEKGMGIGLAVSRSIVEAHGGRLWAENNKTGGATFNVALLLPQASVTTA